MSCCPVAFVIPIAETMSSNLDDGPRPSMGLTRGAGNISIVDQYHCGLRVAFEQNAQGG